jgi:hypothetical protein
MKAAGRVNLDMTMKRGKIRATTRDEQAGD